MFGLLGLNTFADTLGVALQDLPFGQTIPRVLWPRASASFAFGCQTTSSAACRSGRYLLTIHANILSLLFHVVTAGW